MRNLGVCFIFVAMCATVSYAQVNSCYNICSFITKRPVCTIYTDPATKAETYFLVFNYCVVKKANCFEGDEALIITDQNYKCYGKEVVGEDLSGDGTEATPAEKAEEAKYAAAQKAEEDKRAAA